MGKGPSPHATPTARRVLELARVADAQFVHDPDDEWEQLVYALNGGAGLTDRTHKLLLALQRVGTLTSTAMVAMVVQHLREVQWARGEAPWFAPAAPPPEQDDDGGDYSAALQPEGEGELALDLLADDPFAQPAPTGAPLPRATESRPGPRAPAVAHPEAAASSEDGQQGLPFF